MRLFAKAAIVAACLSFGMVGARALPVSPLAPETVAPVIEAQYGVPRVAPRYVAPRVAPRYVAPRYAPRYVAPRYTPRYVAPVAPRYAPGYVAPRYYARPVYPAWRPRPYYGRYWRPGVGWAVGSVVALGVLGAAAAAAYAPPPPDPGACWYYTDPSQTQGYWDACP